MIAELDPALFRTQAEQARATVQRLEADAERARAQCDDAGRRLERARTLAGQQLIAIAELDSAEAAMRQAAASVAAAAAQTDQAMAALRQAEVNLAHTVITAPIDGVVISRNVDVGQTVAASMQAPTLFVIARDLARMQVNASVAESDIGRIADGQRASFHVDAYPGVTFTGTVAQVRLQPVVEQNVVSYVTVIDVPNPGLALKPGMTASVSIEVARAERALRVPNAALRLRPSPELFAAAGAAMPDEAVHGPGVWLLVDGRLEHLAVEAGVSDGALTAVEGYGLTEGAVVITGLRGASTPAQAPASSPLLPFGGRGGGRRAGPP